MKEVVFLGYLTLIKVNDQSGQNDKASQGRSFELERESNQQWFVGRTELSNTSCQTKSKRL